MNALPSPLLAPSPQTSQSFLPRWKFFGLTVLLALTAGGAVWVYTPPIAIGSDQITYFSQARFLVDDGVFYYRDFINLEKTGPKFIFNGPERNQCYPAYAPGYPLVLAAAITVFGNGAEFCVNSVLVAGCVLMMYALARVFLAPALAFLCAFTLVASPTFLLNAQLQNTHTLGVLLPLLAFWSLFAASRKDYGEWTFYGFALCGMLLGYNAGVRYPDALLLLAPLAYVLTAQNLPRPRGQLLLAGAVGALIPLALLGYYHYAAFGSPFRTAYFFTGEQNHGFSPAFFTSNFWVYIPGIVNYLTGPAAFLWLLAALFIWRIRRGEKRWFWLAWIAPLFVAYHFYYWAIATNRGYYLTMRFYEPIVPAVIICGWRGVRDLFLPLIAGLKKYRAVASGKKAAFYLAGAFVAIQSIWAVKIFSLTGEEFYSVGKHAERQVFFAEQTLPTGAIVFYAPAEKNETLNYEELFGRHRWHLFSSEVFAIAETQQKIANFRTENQADRKRDLPQTGQEDRRLNLLAQRAEQLFADFYAAMQNRKNRGVPFFFFGNLESFPRFRALAENYFAFGEPIAYDDVAPRFLLFDHNPDYHYERGEKVFETFPDLVAVPLTWKNREFNR